MFDRIQNADGSPVRHAERDPIVVEPASSSDPEGINAELAYERGQVAAQLVEHNVEGVHDTIKIPRIFLDVRWLGGGTFECTSRSYAGGLYSENVASVTRLSLGAYRIDLLEGVPASVNLQIHDLTITAESLSGDFTAVAVRLSSINAADQIDVERREGTKGSMALADGSFTIAIFAEAVA